MHTKTLRPFTKFCLAVLLASMAASCNAKDEPTAAAPPPVQAQQPATPPTAEHAKYQAMQQNLQQILQEVQALDKENARLEQVIQQAEGENQKLGDEIDKIRPEVDAPAAKP